VMTKEIEEQNQVLPDNVTQIVAVGPDTNPDVVNQQLLSEDLTGQRSVGAGGSDSFMMDSEDYQVGPNTFPETTNGLQPMKEASSRTPAQVSGVQPVRDGVPARAAEPSPSRVEAPPTVPASLWVVLLVLVAAVAFGVPGAFRLGQSWNSSSPPAPPPTPAELPGEVEPVQGLAADAAVPNQPVVAAVDGAIGMTDSASLPLGQGEEAEGATEPTEEVESPLPQGEQPPPRTRRRRPPRRPTTPMMDTPF